MNTDHRHRNASQPPSGGYSSVRLSILFLNLAVFGIAACGVGGTANDETSEPVSVVQAALTTSPWTNLPAYPTAAGPAQIQLLMDGTVLANDSGAIWHRLIPDPIKGYAGGRWVPAASTNYARTFYAAGLLSNGQYFVGGGEYLDDLNGNEIKSPNRNKCEIYDPSANYPTGQWRSVRDFPGDLADGIVTPTTDGTLLVAGIGDATLRRFDPANAAAPWSPVATLPAPFTTFNEGSLTRLQNDGNFLYQNGGSEYVPGNPAHWLARVVPAFNPYGTVYCPVPGVANAAYPCSSEGGAALTLYDGRVFVAGATGYNAVYDPTNKTIANVATTPTARIGLQLYTQQADPNHPDPNDPKHFVYTNTNKLVSAGPRMDENGQVVMPTGNILATVTGWDFSNNKFYELKTSGTLSFVDVSAGGPTSCSGNVLQTPLPDGSVMVACSAKSTIFAYRPAGSQLTKYGQPTIQSIAGPVNGSFTLTGTTLNGLTNGANRDDEGQNYTSFPVVSLAYLFSGQKTLRYATVTQLSTTSIAPGVASTINFTIPDDVPREVPLTVSVSASGLASSNSKVIGICSLVLSGQTLPGFPAATYYEESCDTRFTLEMQGDGNLVLYQGPQALWASGTRTPGSRAVMQGDGNLVVYSPSNVPLWSTGTFGNPGAYLRVQNDGNLVVYSATNAVLWASGTCCH